MGTDGAIPLPGPLRLTPTFAFAGRERGLATLRALLPRSTGEGRRAAFLAGEAGSGKSRLVRELAAEVAAEGATVLYGDCDGVVGINDLLQLLAAWGKCPGCPEDIDGDGTVGINDLLDLLAAWTV